jgi:hypothetical protein
VVEIKKNDQEKSVGKNEADLGEPSISNDVDEDLLYDLAHNSLSRESIEGTSPQGSIELTRRLQNKDYRQCRSLLEERGDLGILKGTADNNHNLTQSGIRGDAPGTQICLFT